MSSYVASSSTSATPNLQEVKRLNAKDLNDFLKKNLSDIDNHIDTLTAEEVDGSVFFDLTHEALKAFGVSLKASTKIVKLIRDIQGDQSVAGIPKDITAEIIEKLVQSPNQLPAIYELKNFLNEKPSVKIPLAPIHFTLFPIGHLDGITEQERDTYFVQNTEAECTSLFYKYLGQLISPPTYGKNEDSYHAFWDSIIKSTIEVFGKHSSGLPTLEFDRNTSKRTSTGSNRPDMVILVRNVCPFRGEEKSREDTGDPSKELIEKFRDWTYGDAPYLLAYYAVGVLVTFVTLHKPEEEANKKRKRSVYSQRIEEFDLSRLSHRIRAMNFLRNICRLLPLIVNLCPPRELPDFETIMRPNGTIIELGYSVKKSFNNEEDVNHLKEIYGILFSNKIRFSDRLEHSSKHSVHLVPRGTQEEPSDLKELLQALICLLTCLRRRLQGVSGIDHAPEMLKTIHDTSVDVWGVGNLVGTCNINGIPQELSQFGLDLCHRTPRKRPNASEALEQVKDMFRKWFDDDDDDDNWLEEIERDS